ncbi:MAG: acyltransferase [Fibrobacter sp.]|jgi:peptidoglycan/LPS O-acetylase OafA/YrhL|nr:acyltransferase [Fibrobacter sp.]
MAKNSFYFPALDGLRLLASLNIVLLHLGSSNALGYLKSEWLKPVIQAPAFAAGLFFVLAGFLFGSKFHDPERKVAFLPFMRARFLKLYRLHFVCTILMFVILAVRFGGLEGLYHPWRSLVLHLTLTWAIVPDLGMKLNEPSWALTAFFFCYAVTPAFSKRLNSISMKKVYCLCALVFIPGIIWGILFGLNFGDFASYESRYRFYHVFVPVRICEYLFGMILFRIYKERGFDFLKKKFVSGALQFSLLALLYVSLFFLETESAAWNYICHHTIPILIYGALILSLTASRGFLGTLFCIRPVRQVGKASFYPYLIHLPMIAVFWCFADLNTPLNLLVFLVVIYGLSTFYQMWKDSKRKKKISKTA